MSHASVDEMLKIHAALTRAHLLACQFVCNPTTENAIEVRTSIEEVQYKLDQAAMAAIKEIT